MGKGEREFNKDSFEPTKMGSYQIPNEGQDWQVPFSKICPSSTQVSVKKKLSRVVEDPLGFINLILAYPLTSR